MKNQKKKKLTQNYDGNPVAMAKLHCNESNFSINLSVFLALWYTNCTCVARFIVVFFFFSFSKVSSVENHDQKQTKRN